MSDSPQRPGRICVIGLGYVGTTLAVTLAGRGCEVWAVDRDDEILRMLSAKTSHLHERGLEPGPVVDAGLLRASRDIPLDPAIDAYIVCVGTPADSEGRADLTQVETVVRGVVEAAKDGDLIVLRSTVPVGTTRRLRDSVLAGCGKDLKVAYCPERTVEGSAVDELTTLPQIVAGGDADGHAKARLLFQVLTDRIVEVMDLEAAEVAKLACNAFRYAMFAFANEMARLCEGVGTSVIETRDAAVLGYGRAPIPLPGPSGGPCLPKDAMFLSRAFREFTAAPSQFLESVSKVHDDVPAGITDVLLRHAQPLAAAGDVTVTLLGVAFKGSPETDDVRASPAVSITEQLRARLPVKEIRSHDPVVNPERQRDLGYHSCATVDEAVHGAQLVIIGTNHELYTRLSLTDLAAHLPDHGVIYDTWALHAKTRESLPETVTYLAFGEG